MSVSAHINIDLTEYTGTPISSVDKIKALLDYGWTLNDHGLISYLPIGDKDDFNWQRESISEEALLNIVKSKEKAGEIIGVSITWNNSNIGGDLLIFEDGTLSLSACINRQEFVTKDEYKITDVNWYLERLLPAFKQKNWYIESHSYEEIA